MRKIGTGSVEGEDVRRLTARAAWGASGPHPHGEGSCVLVSSLLDLPDPPVNDEPHRAPEHLNSGVLKANDLPRSHLVACGGEHAKSRHRARPRKAEDAGGSSDQKGGEWKQEDVGPRAHWASFAEKRATPVESPTSRSIIFRCPPLLVGTDRVSATLSTWETGQRGVRQPLRRIQRQCRINACRIPTRRRRSRCGLSHFNYQVHPVSLGPHVLHVQLPPRDQLGQVLHPVAPPGSCGRVVPLLGPASLILLPVASPEILPGSARGRRLLLPLSVVRHGSQRARMEAATRKCVRPAARVVPLPAQNSRKFRPA